MSLAEIDCYEKNRAGGNVYDKLPSPHPFWVQEYGEWKRLRGMEVSFLRCVLVYDANNQITDSPVSDQCHSGDMVILPSPLCNYPCMVGLSSQAAATGGW